MITKNHWIVKRQANSTVSWNEIVASGWDAVPCDCGKQGCLGWKLARVNEPPKVNRPFNNDPPLVA